MRVKSYNVYKFEELSEKAKRLAIETCRYYGVDEGWWQTTYEDAERVGIKLTGFDIDRGSYCHGEFIQSSVKAAQAIVKDHGDICETYKTAKSFLDDVAKLPKEEDGEFTSQDDFEDLQSEFLKSILEDYRINLHTEYEYLTSDEQVIEMLTINEYEFNENGERE